MKGLILISIIAYAAAMQMCETDQDCKHLGHLVCVKSACKWGICSCSQGEAAKFVGSERQIRCVKLKRIGEKCSTDGMKGLCAAMNSHCANEKCQCDADHFSSMGGEYCLKANSLIHGETCTSTGSLGAGTCTYDNKFTYAPLNFVKPVKMCTSGHMVMGNKYTAHPTFPGALFPECRNRGKIGDLCLSDSNCPTTRAKCDKTKARCVCSTSGEVPDIDNTMCGAAIAKGDTCGVAANTVCDGTKGLVCGDVCDITGAAQTCVCAPGYLTVGSTCQMRKAGAECFGDENCKAFSPRGVCRNGQCVDVTLSIAPLSTSSFALYAITVCIALCKSFAFSM